MEKVFFFFATISCSIIGSEDVIKIQPLLTDVTESKNAKVKSDRFKCLACTHNSCIYCNVKVCENEALLQCLMKRLLPSRKKCS